MLQSHLIWQSAAHVHFGSRPVAKAAIKAFLAYSGALLMAFDAASALAGPHLFPHIFHSCEGAISCGGKVGAAAAGFSALFDGLLKAVLSGAAVQAGEA